jgi:hypothetical protein
MTLGQLATLASPAIAGINPAMQPAAAGPPRLVQRPWASVTLSQRIFPIQAVLLFVLAQQLASLTIHEMQLGASRASDPFIFVVGRLLIVRQQMLDVHRCRRAGENEMGHRQNMMAPRYYTMM